MTKAQTEKEEKVKRYFAMLCVFAIAVCTCADQYHDYTSGITWTYDFDTHYSCPSYNENEIAIRITGVSGASGEVRIPSFSIDKYDSNYGYYRPFTGRVVEIGSRAFSSCTKMTSLKVPTCIQYVYHDAFYGCTSFVRFEMDSDYSSNRRYDVIGGLLYDYSSSSDYKTLCMVPNGVTELKIPSGTTYVSASFDYCTTLKSILIPKTVTSISRYDFDGINENITVYFEAGDGARVKELLAETGVDCSSMTFVRKPPIQYHELFPIVPDGVHDWVPYDGESHDSGISLQGPELDRYEGSYITFDVDASKSVSWWWKIADEGSFDYLNCYVNGQRYDWMSGAQGWSRMTIPSQGYYASGKRTIKIEYERRSYGQKRYAGCLIDGLLALDQQTPSVQYRDLYDIVGDGSKTWTKDSSVTKIGPYSYKSPAIGNNGSTYITFEADASKGVTWWWKVSSQEGHDYLRCYVNGDKYHEISGIQNWELVKIPESYGVCTVKIEYSKDSYGYSGSDCGWIDGLATQCDPEWMTEPLDDGSVQLVGPNDFSGILSITNAYGDSSVSTIGDWLFECCSTLSSVTIQDGIERIGRGAFYGCENLSAVKIPSSVTKIDADAFRDTAIVESSSAGPVIVDGCVIGVKEPSPAIVTLPSTVRLIADGVLTNSPTLTTVCADVGDSERIRGLLLASGVSAGVLSVVEKTTVSFYSAEGACDLAMATYVPGLTYGSLPWPEREGYMFKGWFTAHDGGTQVYATDSVGTVPSLTLYARWEPITWLYTSNKDNTLTITGCVPRAYGHVDIPAGIGGCRVTGIGSRAFKGSGLTGLSLPAGIERFDASAVESTPFWWDRPDGLVIVGDWLLGYKTLSNAGYPKNLVIPEGVTAIADGAFKSNSYIYDVQFPKGLRSIGASAFQYCCFSAIQFPEGVERIGDSAFGSCYHLCTVSFPTSLKYIGSRAFARSGTYSYGSSCENITLISIVATNLVIGSYAFAEQPFDYVSVHGKNIDIEASAFARSSSSYVEATTWNTATVSLCGDEITVGDRAFACVLHPKVEMDLTGVTSIGAYAFAMAGYNKGYLNSDSYYGLGGVTVKLSSKLRHADVTAFSGSALGRVYVQNLQDVFNIDGWLGFASCEPSILSGYYRLLEVNGVAQTSISIPNVHDRVPVAAFCGIHLTSINVPASVRSIEADAFYRCRASRIELPPTLDTLGEYALADNRFTDIRIPSGVTELATNVLRACSSLKRAVVPATVGTIRGGAFAQCKALESIVFWGNAPVVEATDYYGWKPFDGVPTTCVVYVKSGAAGWDDDGDGLWNGFEVRRFSPCTLTLNACGGTAAVNSIACGKDVPVGALPTPTRDGYRFVGWYTATQGGSVIDEASQLSSSRTCYAHWEREYKITYEGAEGFINWNPACYTSSDAITFDPLYVRASSDTLNIPNGFVEWSPQRIVAGTTGDLVVSAKWVRVSAEVRSALSQEGVFTIDYTVGGGYALVDADVIVNYVSGGSSKTAQSLSGDVSCTPGSHTIYWNAKADGVDLSKPLTVSVKLYRDPGSLTYEHDQYHPWQQTSNVKYNGQNSWESDSVSGWSSTLKLKVNRTGTLSFVWKVSSEEYYDSLSYYVDGQYRKSISGTVGWTTNIVTFTTGSAHTVTLNYSKDDEDSAGSDCGWVADIVWTPALKKYITAYSDTVSLSAPRCVTFNDVRCGNETRWLQSGSAIGELPTREQSGYVFEGWYTENEGGVLVTPETLVDGTLTVYAHWRIGQSSVTFDPQGGEFVSAVDNPRIVSGGAALGELPQVVRTGYDFTGWSYNGSSVDATTVLAGDVTVRAQWIAHVYSIAYHPADGTGTMPNQQMTYGVAKALSANAFARKGYRFLGWGTQPVGGVVYGAGASVSNLTAVSSGSIDLYAQWEAKSYELRFYANDGTGEMANQPLVYDVPQSIRSCTFERIGYDFTGWRDASGNGYADGQSVVNLSSQEGAIIDLTAQWSLHAYLVGEVLEGPWQTGGNNVAQGFVDSSSSAGFSVKLTTAKSSESWVELTVTNAVRVVFDWKTSCEEEEGGEMFDGMTLSVDGVPVKTLCGESGWVTDVVQEVAGTGVHTLRWTYAKDSRINAGEDCAWLANVRIYPVVGVMFDGNGNDAGVVPVAVQGCEGDSFALPSPGSLAKACHEFAGWQVGDDVLAAGALVSIVGQDMTIKATWRAKVVPRPVVSLPSGVSDREGQKYFTTESIAVEVSAAANATVRYTTDGSVPTEQSPVLTGGAFVVDRTMVLKLKAFADDWFASEVVAMSFLRAPWTPSECLDAKLSFTSAGDADWARDLTVSHDGVASMRSGAIGNRQTSGLTATVSGAGRISFWCKVSSEAEDDEACDGLRFYVDGVEMTAGLLGGEVDWQNLAYDVETVGTHVLKWQYEKDRGDYADVGLDCAWIDEVKWSPADPIPDLGDDPTEEQIAEALVDSADANLAEKITDGETYNDFRDWAGKVKDGSGKAAGSQAVKESPNAWVSFALGQDELLNEAPTDEDLTIEAFGPAATGGKFDFTVSVKDIEVGSEAAAENLKKVFGLEGGSSLQGLSSDNVDIAFGTPEDGKVKFTAGPSAENADAKTFFMKVKVNP